MSSIRSERLTRIDVDRLRDGHDGVVGKSNGDRVVSDGRVSLVDRLIERLDHVAHVEAPRGRRIQTGDLAGAARVVVVRIGDAGGRVQCYFARADAVRPRNQIVGIDVDGRLEKDEIVASSQVDHVLSDRGH